MKNIKFGFPLCKKHENGHGTSHTEMSILRSFLGIFGLLVLTINNLHAQPNSTLALQPILTYEQYIRQHVATRQEIDSFLKGPSWAQFDSKVGYILGNFIPHDGIDQSATISTIAPNRARTSFVYANRPCRINTYGNSFTQCHQVSDGETWQEYLAAHLGEPVRNFGMGGYGVHQSYQRMLLEEKSKYGAEYLVFYIWGDDHIRSLLRCRYMLISEWMQEQEGKEGKGKMFQGNFWPNVEMDLKTGKMVENPSRITSVQGLYQMTNPDWMYENLKDDLGLQMALFKRGLIKDIDVSKLRMLARHLGASINLTSGLPRPQAVGKLLDQYAFAATKYILDKVKTYTETQKKKLLVVLFDPYQVTKPLLRGEQRYDSTVVNYLEQNHYNYFDMNLIHVQDYQQFKGSVDDYFKRYFIGHYNPSGNHFFAYAIKPKIVAWLEPKPLPYRSEQQQIVDFRGYLEGY